MDMNKIGQMSCNPAMGGIAKADNQRNRCSWGQIGIVSDRSSIQFRMLNRSKGQLCGARRSKRPQCFYSRMDKRLIPNLYVWQDTVTQLIIETVKLPVL